MGHPRPLFRLFTVIVKQNIQFLHQINVKKCHVHAVYSTRIQTHDLLYMSCFPLPLDQGSRPEPSFICLPNSQFRRSIHFSKSSLFDRSTKICWKLFWRFLDGNWIRNFVNIKIGRKLEQILPAGFLKFWNKTKSQICELPNAAATVTRCWNKKLPKFEHWLWLS